MLFYNFYKFYNEFKYETGFITEKLIRNEAKQFIKRVAKHKGEMLDIDVERDFIFMKPKKLVGK